MTKKISIALALAAFGLLLSISQVSIVNAANLTADAGAATNNTLRSEGVISITDLVKPHALNTSKEVSLKTGSFHMQGLWNPNGEKILMLSRISWSQSEEVDEIYVMNVDGTELNKIVLSKKMETKGAWIANPVWSLSGDKIVFQLTQPKGSLLAAVNPDGTDLKAIGTNFSDIESILSFLSEAGWWQRNPKWSPDMTKVAFEFEVEKNSAGSNERVYVADVDGSNLRDLYSGTSNNPVWSHDSKKIVFRTIGEQSSLIRINMDGTDVKYLSNGTKYISYGWSPDDSRILYLTSKDVNGREQWDLYIVNADGTGTKEIMSGSWIENPSWSPDGSKILFQEVAYENGLRNINVHIVDADGKNLKNILNGDIGMLSWSPSGEKIAFVDKHSLYTMNLDGTEKVLLALTGWGDLLQQPAYTWSPSGNKIAFSAIIDPVTGKQVDFGTFWTRRDSYEAHIFLTNPDGTEPIQLTTNGQSYVIAGGWSPDGSRLIIGSSSDIEMRALNVSIIKLGGYDEVLSVYSPTYIEQGKDVFIEVKSMSKPVDNAVVSLDGKEIGATNETGFLKYSFKEAGNYKLNAAKQGFRTASKSITIQEQAPEQKVDTATPVPTTVADAPKTPGFSSIFAGIMLIISIFLIKGWSVD